MPFEEGTTSSAKRRIESRSMPSINELPRAYARTSTPSPSSSSTSSSSDSTDSSRYKKRRRHVSSSSSSTPDFSKTLRKRAFKRSTSEKRRKSHANHGTSVQRSNRQGKRRRVTPEQSSSSSSSTSSSSSSSQSSTREHRRRERSDSRSECRSTRKPYYRHGQTDRADRFYSPRPVSSKSTLQTYDCHCGERYGSRKALIHHTIQNHDADAPCFACSKTLPSLSELEEHIKSEHTKALIVCVYCKSVFGKADAMTDNQWKRLKTHMYGELVYAKLAEMQEEAS